VLPETSIHYSVCRILLEDEGTGRDPHLISDALKVKAEGGFAFFPLS